MDYVAFFQQNEKTIARFHKRIHETPKSRTTPAGKEAWSRACEEFHARYDSLAFPGGYSNALQRIKSNESDAIEAALVFLELRPYFFRPGYMREALMRRLKHSSLNIGQANRFSAVIEAQRQWRSNRAQEDGRAAPRKKRAVRSP